MDNYEKNSLFEKFVLDGTDLGRAQVSCTSQETVVQESDGTKCTVYAFAVRDILKKNEPVKDLHFFNTGGVINNELENVWTPLQLLVFRQESIN